MNMSNMSKVNSIMTSDRSQNYSCNAPGKYCSVLISIKHLIVLKIFPCSNEYNVFTNRVLFCNIYLRQEFQTLVFY